MITPNFETKFLKILETHITRMNIWWGTHGTQKVSFEKFCFVKQTWVRRRRRRRRTKVGMSLSSPLPLSSSPQWSNPIFKTISPSLPPSFSAWIVSITFRYQNACLPTINLSRYIGVEKLLHWTFCPQKSLICRRHCTAGKLSSLFRSFVKRQVVSEEQPSG